MVIVPDVQGYVKLRRNHSILELMHGWIVDYRESMRIQQVLFTWDLTNRNDLPVVEPGRNELIGAEQWKVFSMDKNSAGKSVAQMAFNTQAIGDGWLRLLEFMPDKKNVKARTFSPLFYVSPETRHLVWKHDELSEFTFETE